MAHGSSYTSKFAGKSGGFTIMASRLKRFWDIPTLWPICFSILFGLDVADFNFNRTFNVANMLEVFGKRKVAYPESSIIITSMLQHGLKEVMKHQEDPESPAKAAPSAALARVSLSDPKRQARSMELGMALETRCKCLFSILRSKSAPDYRSDEAQQSSLEIVSGWPAMQMCCKPHWIF